MIRKTIITLLFLFFLLVVQTSFLPHFSLKGAPFSLFLITIILICLFSRDSNFALILAFIGGFYLDIYSLSRVGFFGFYTLALLGLAFFLRLVIRKYVQLPVFK